MKFQAISIDILNWYSLNPESRELLSFYLIKSRLITIIHSFS